MALNRISEGLKASFESGVQGAKNIFAKLGKQDQNVDKIAKDVFKGAESSDNIGKTHSYTTEATKAEKGAVNEKNTGYTVEGEEFDFWPSPKKVEADTPLPVSEKVTDASQGIFSRLRSALAEKAESLKAKFNELTSAIRPQAPIPIPQELTSPAAKNLFQAIQSGAFNRSPMRESLIKKLKGEEPSDFSQLDIAEKRLLLVALGVAEDSFQSIPVEAHGFQTEALGAGYDQGDTGIYQEFTTVKLKFDKANPSNEEVADAANQLVDTWKQDGINPKQGVFVDIGDRLLLVYDEADEKNILGLTNSMKLPGGHDSFDIVYGLKSLEDQVG